MATLALIRGAIHVILPVRYVMAHCFPTVCSAHHPTSSMINRVWHLVQSNTITWVEYVQDANLHVWRVWTRQHANHVCHPYPYGICHACWFVQMEHTVLLVSVCSVNHPVRYVLPMPVGSVSLAVTYGMTRVFPVVHLVPTTILSIGCANRVVCHVQPALPTNNSVYLAMLDSIFCWTWDSVWWYVHVDTTNKTLNALNARIPVCSVGLTSAPAAATDTISMIRNANLPVPTQPTRITTHGHAQHAVSHVSTASANCHAHPVSTVSYTNTAASMYVQLDRWLNRVSVSHVWPTVPTVRGQSVTAQPVNRDSTCWMHPVCQCVQKDTTPVVYRADVCHARQSAKNVWATVSVRSA